jgi:DNA-binding CsgD family transcriptional regulator
MPGFGPGDVRRSLEVVESIGAPERADPFPLETLQALQRLLDAEAVGYCESPSGDGFGGYELGTRVPPAWLPEALRLYARQDPTHPVLCGDAPGTVAVSDFLGERAVRRSDVYAAIWRPLGLADSLRLYLPPSRETARFFFFDRAERGFPEARRRLLELLRPALIRARSGWLRPAAGRVAQLTERESEVLSWVALGLTNDQIARRLWLSPHTVRTHLDHIFRKLGVRSRTEAARFARSPATPA